MAKVFISYRRADNAAGYAMDLARVLRETFGDQHVFRDMRSIPPGVDFGAFIRQALESCTVMLVVIGRHWTTELTEDGRPRLLEPGDWVRIEVATALAAPHVRVIPVLVGGGTLPRAELLPPDLQPLLNRHAVTLEDRKWESDVASLVADLEQVPGLRSWWQRLRHRPQSQPSGKRRRRPRLAIAAAILGLAVVGGGAGLLIDSMKNTTPVFPVDSEWATIVASPPLVSKGGPSKASAPPAAFADLAGVWMDGQGNRYRLRQDATELTIEQLSGPGAGIGSGAGYVSGGAVDFSFYINGVQSSSGSLVLSPDARSMQGHVRDTFTGITMPLYLQRL